MQVKAPHSQMRAGFEITFWSGLLSSSDTGYQTEYASW